jgi:ATP-dependent protease ClpP protease subunit
MTKIVKTDSLDHWHDHDVYPPARLISLMGDIDEERAAQFVKNIRLLDFVNDKDITVLLSSEGGSVHYGMQIFDAIKECHSKVTVHAVGPCYSMSSVILQAADHRKISANATVMIHVGSEEYPEDHALNVKRWIEENKRIEKETTDILYQRIKEKKNRFQRKQLDKLLTFDTIYTAEQAIDMGLADKIEEHKGF